MNSKEFINKGDFNRGKEAIEVFKATIKQLRTSDGLGVAKGLQVGQTVICVVMSLRAQEFETKAGVKHKKFVYDIIDINGKPLGWIYAEWIFPEMIIL